MLHDAFYRLSEALSGRVHRTRRNAGEQNKHSIVFSAWRLTEACCESESVSVRAAHNAILGGFTRVANKIYSMIEYNLPGTIAST